MTLADAGFLALRLVTALLCAIAAWDAWRYAARQTEVGRRRRARFAAALIAALGAMTIVEGHGEAVLRAGERIPVSGWLWLFADLLLPLLFLATLRAMGQRDALEAELAAAARRDPLTGLPNRAGFTEAATAALAAAARSGAPASVAMLDVDHFKRINDGWGHAAGDAVLRDVAAALADARRPGDVLGRLGGEEFALVLPGLGPAEALAVLERLRAAAASVSHPGAPALSVSVSGGLAAARGADLPALEAALRAADAALYAAKEAGRNRIAVAAG